MYSIGTWAPACLTYAFSHLHMFHLCLHPRPAGKWSGKAALGGGGSLSCSHAICLAYRIHTSSTASWNLALDLWNCHRADCRGKKIWDVKWLCSNVSQGCVLFIEGGNDIWRKLVQGEMLSLYKHSNFSNRLARGVTHWLACKAPKRVIYPLQGDEECRL